MHFATKPWKDAFGPVGVKNRVIKEYMKNSRICFTAIVQILFFLLLPAALQAGEATLAWDPNQETNLAGYKLYYDSDSDIEMYGGTGANEGDSPIVIYLKDLEEIKSPTYTLTGLTTGEYYYFALTAFDTDGMESDFSEEVGTLVGVGSSLAKAVSDTDTTSEESNGSSCFISGTMGNNAENFPMAAAAVFLLMAAAIVMHLHPIRTIINACRKKRLR